MTAWVASAALVLAAEPPLTNADVLGLFGAGLSAETIVAKIDASRCAFETDVDSLVALKRDGLPDAVLQAMIRCQDGHGARHAPVVVPATPPADDMQLAWRSAAGTVTLHEATGVGSRALAEFWNGAARLELPGGGGPEIDACTPSFEVHHDPARRLGALRLVPLEAGTGRRERRLVPGHDLVPLQIASRGEGLAVVTPAAALHDGPWALVYRANEDDTPRVFEFTVACGN